MSVTDSPDWKQKIVPPDKVLSLIEPGMSIYLGTGVSEPRTLVKHLMTSDRGNLRDLELIQLVSLGDAISFSSKAYAQKFRLKTFFAGWLASEAITTGSVDFIPCRLSRIPRLVQSRAIEIDAVFVQIAPPDEAGYASLGVAIDVAKYAMEKASLVVGEINDEVPYTLGNTFVDVNDFHYLIRSEDPLIYFPRWSYDEVIDKVAANVASVVEDGSCIAFFSGIFYEALGKHLTHKKDLGIHTIFFTDPLMELMKCGAANNRKKGYFRGKALTCYAQGTPELMRWLHRNPLVEFQGLDIVVDHLRISLNDRMVSILPARKVGLTGDIALQAGRGNVTASPGQSQEFFAGAEHSRGGRTIFALPSRNLKGASNILLSVDEFPNQFTNRESLDLIVTEYGIASMSGRSLRERAQLLIDIAHPDDRPELIRQAKQANILYEDQIYLSESGCLYPEHLGGTHTFQDGLTVRFRAIKPSDEEEMRRLFYRFSDHTVYYRYFSAVKAMPHGKMQQYVNIDYRRIMSIVGLVDEEGVERIIAEGRYVCLHDKAFADTAFVVDENYQGRGIATHLIDLLMKSAQQQGLEGFTADVLAENKSMLKVFEKTGLPIRSVFEFGVYNLTIPFASDGAKAARLKTLPPHT
ncbi:MAG: GNAT family N-acetyltransferase [Deltaproteobacteria bacterium]|nr:GNAT family N-acetyltransferase [Deltaproteobacteria bacterium]